MTRDVETIDQELRHLAAMRAAPRELGGKSTSMGADELLDEQSDLDGDHVG